MTDLRKAAEMALKDWLANDEGVVKFKMQLKTEWISAASNGFVAGYEIALRQALAESANSTTDFVESKASGQPEQEPVAWMDRDSGVVGRLHQWKNAIPLYTAPPKREWQGLTDEDYKELLDSNWGGSLTKAIEAKLKEKNT